MILNITYPQNFDRRLIEAKRYWVERYTPVFKESCKWERIDTLVNRLFVLINVVMVGFFLWKMLFTEDFDFKNHLIEITTNQDINTLFTCVFVLLIIVIMGELILGNARKVAVKLLLGKKVKKANDNCDAVVKEAKSYGFYLNLYVPLVYPKDFVPCDWDGFSDLDRLKESKVSSVSFLCDIGPVSNTYNIKVEDPGKTGKFKFDLKLCPDNILDTADFSFLDTVSLYPENIKEMVE